MNNTQLDRVTAGIPCRSSQVIARRATPRYETNRNACGAISCIVGGTGQIWLHFPSRWEGKLLCCSVKPSQAALIRAAFSFSNLSAHNKNPNPNGFGFSLLLVYTLDITFRHLKQPVEFQKVKYFVRKFRQPTVHR